MQTQKGVAAQIEEVIVNSDLVAPQNALPDFRDLLLQAAARSGKAGAHHPSSRLWLRGTLFIQFLQKAIGRQGLAQFHSSLQILRTYDYLREIAGQNTVKNLDAFRRQNSIRQHLLAQLSDMGRNLGIDANPNLLPDFPVDGECGPLAANGILAGACVKKSACAAIISLPYFAQD